MRIIFAMLAAVCLFYEVSALHKAGFAMLDTAMAQAIGARK